MSHDNPDYLHLTSHKFSITCKTCGVTETFYSELSVGYFRLKHAGHELVEGAPRVSIPAEPEDREPAKPAKRMKVPPEVEAAVLRLSKVLVDTRVSPQDGMPVIRVRGFREDGTLDFVQLFKPEEAGKMREFLGSGRYEDVDGGFVYAWDTEVVSFQEEATPERVPIEPKSDEVQERAFEPLVEPKQDELQERVFEPPADSVDSVASSMEELSPEVVPERIVEPPRAPEPPRPVREEPRPVEAPPAVEEEVEVKVVERVEKAAPAPQIQQAPAAEKKVEKAKKNHETLLLAKSSYIQEGEESMSEAIRISKVLKAFRWNVEPVYTIGVIIDDNLSIETNKGEITGKLLRAIENAGYSLSAVTSTGAKPTAWFKRRPSMAISIVDDPERTRHLERKVEELSKTLRDERVGAEQQKTAWEERFMLLTKLVSSLRQGVPQAGTENGDAEPQPETDVTS